MPHTALATSTHTCCVDSVKDVLMAAPRMSPLPGLATRLGPLPCRPMAGCRPAAVSPSSPPGRCLCLRHTDQRRLEVRSLVREAHGTRQAHLVKYNGKEVQRKRSCRNGTSTASMARSQHERPRVLSSNCHVHVEGPVAHRIALAHVVH